MIDAVYKIIVGVAAECGVSTDAVLSRSRLKSVTRARALAMLVIRKRYLFSTPEIGKVFGRDHTTVLAALSRARSDPLAGQLLAVFARDHAPLAGEVNPHDRLDVAAA